MKLKMTEFMTLYGALMGINAMYMVETRDGNQAKDSKDCPALPGKVIYAIGRCLKSAKPIVDSYREAREAIARRAQQFIKADPKPSDEATKDFNEALMAEVKDLDASEVDFEGHQFSLKFSEIETCKIAPWMIRDLDGLVLTVVES